MLEFEVMKVDLAQSRMYSLTSERKILAGGFVSSYFAASVLQIIIQVT